MKDIFRALSLMLLPCIVLATSCNGHQAMVSPQKTINSEVEKVVLAVFNKTGMSARELVKNAITASRYDADSYEIEYSDIKPDEVQGAVSVSFRLKKMRCNQKCGRLPWGRRMLIVLQQKPLKITGNYR